LDNEPAIPHTAGPSRACPTEDSSLRVAHVVTAFSVLSETFIFDSIVDSVRRGVDAQVITHRRENIRERPFEPVHLISLPSRWHFERVLSRLRVVLKLTEADQQYTAMLRRGLKQRLSELRPDVIHAHFGDIGWTVAPVATALRIPLVVTFYGYDVSMLTRRQSWRRRFGELANRTDLAIAISDHICQKLPPLGFLAQKIKKLYLGVDLGAIPYTDPCRRFDGRTVRYLHVGRLVAKKSPINLVRSFAIARAALSSHCDARLTIAGDGPLRGELVATIDSLGLRDSIDLLGATDHQRVLELYAASHVYTQHCVTAENGDEEGMGLSFAEASASGLPIISTVHNGIPEVVIHGKSGYLVAEGDVQGMADQMISAARNPQLWTPLGLAGREHIQEQFSLPKQTDKYLALLRDVVSPRSNQVLPPNDDGSS
jgi:colanic acid/amylovoran/stewartan biosynthesis glycosyltransferase WcaL/AmsK/CpsK